MRYIERDLPIEGLNVIATAETGLGMRRPIYMIHKWWARRLGSVFRMLILAAFTEWDDSLSAAENERRLWNRFYSKNELKNSEGKRPIILDPFMGGGTTVVEALRLGCKVIGIDLNPVAWFIVKCETTPVDITELERAFDDLAARTVPWSGKPLKETLLSLYKTACPCCGSTDADIIYAFWVKSAICTDPTCRKQVPLFKDYLIAAHEGVENHLAVGIRIAGVVLVELLHDDFRAAFGGVAVLIHRQGLKAAQ